MTYTVFWVDWRNELFVRFLIEDAELNDKENLTSETQFSFADFKFQVFTCDK